MKKLLHLIGIHDWSKWSEPYVPEYYKNIKVEVQAHICHICNKLEERLF